MSKTADQIYNELIKPFKEYDFDKIEEVNKHFLKPCLDNFTKKHKSGKFSYCVIEPDRGFPKHMIIYIKQRNMLSKIRDMFWSTSGSSRDETDELIKDWYGEEKPRTERTLVDPDFRTLFSDKIEKILLEWLRDNHPEIVTKEYEKYPERKERALKRQKKAREQGKKKRSLSFTKAQQQHICKQIIQQIENEALKALEDKIGKLFNDKKFSYDWTTLTYYRSRPKSLILSLANESYSEKVDLSGKQLYDSIVESGLDHEKLFKEWMSSKDDILRRFALTYTSTSQAAAMIDKDDLIRTAAKERVGREH